MARASSIGVLQALLAVRAADDGDIAAAEAPGAVAQHHVRRSARRDRQLVEIATLVAAGNRDRAAGLAFEHTVDFPEDRALLRHVAHPAEP